jgi:Na+/proline symporter
VLGRKRPDLRPTDRARPLDWVATAGIVCIGLLIVWLALTGRSEAPPQIVIALAYGSLSLGSWDLWRFARPLDWPFSPELWMYEHLWKMLGAYSAVLSAFSGNFLRFLPPPWSALWPTVLFQSLSLIWLSALLVRKRRSLVPA